MREQREKRQEGGWSFNNYFLLQEELAFMFEMLGLFEDAFVQYNIPLIFHTGSKTICGNSARSDKRAAGRSTTTSSFRKN